MGTLFRRFWMPVLLSREIPEPRRPSSTGTGHGRATWSPSATPSVGSGWSRPGARIEGRTCGLGATRSVGSDASTTAGSSTWAGSAWKSPRWRATTPTYGPSAEPCEDRRLSDARMGRLRLGLLGPREAMPPLPEMEFTMVAPAHVSSPRSCRTATGRRRPRAVSTPRISPSCIAPVGQAESTPPGYSARPWARTRSAG